jgi:hypothetical protein
LGVRVAHVVGSGPLLVYLGATAVRKPAWVYRVVLVVGVLLAAVVAGLLFLRPWRADGGIWLLVHLLVVSPLLLWLGAVGDAAPRVVTSLVLALGCAALGYHVLAMAGLRRVRAV